MNNMFNIDAIRDVIKNKAKEMANNKVANIAKKLQDYLQQEFKVDLAQSPQRSLLDKFSDINVGVEKTSDTSFSISVSTNG